MGEPPIIGFAIVAWRRIGGVRLAAHLLGLTISAGLLAACKSEPAPPVPPTRVKAVAVEVVDFAPPITFTGVVSARNEADLSFRLSGKIADRYVNPGQHVKAGELLARLDPEEQQAELAAAQAGVASAQAQLRQAAADFERQQRLLSTGNTTRREHDQAEAAQRSAQALLQQATADEQSARERLSFTELRVDAPGIITRRWAEAGQVVAQAQPIYTIARDGPRDAVFNIHEWALSNVVLDKSLPIAMVTDPAVKTVGDVWQISPVVNPTTATIKVKINLRETPPAMLLGSLVNAVGPMKSEKAVLLPWGSLFEIDGAPAVWTIDPASNTVSLKPVTINRYMKDYIAVASGLKGGDVVVTAGVQMLRPGQKVEIAAEPRR
jgi:RND family efflux transporter MFP subunit